MSYFSQFTGAQVPVGGVIQAPSGLYQINPTIAGSEYLATGSVKAYSSTYAALVSALPPTGNQLPSTAGVWGLNSTYQQNYTNGLRLEKGGSYFYSFAMFSTGSYSGYYCNYGSSIASAAAGSLYANSSFTDSATFNGNALYTSGLGIGTGNSGVSSGALTGRYTDTVSTNFLAVSSSLAVAVRRDEAVNAATSGFVKTSTNGTSWTDRTISVTGSTTSGTIARATWSTIGNCFIYVTTDGLIYTSTDGYTLTQRSAPSGTPTSITGVYYGQSSMCGSSPTATLISVGGRTSLGGPYVLKTTNGTTFTLIDLSTVSGLSAAYSGTPASPPYIPNITYDTTTSKMVISLTYGTYYTSLPNAVAYSTNDGTSWTLDSTKFISSGTNKVYGMGMCDGNFYMGIGTGDANNSQSMSPNFFNNKIGNTPDYVGYSTAVATGGFTGFLRIA